MPCVDAADLLTWAPPAWAFDAAGRPVPTWYEWDGESLTQIVEHRAGGYAYPIVADPCWGWKCAKEVYKKALIGSLIGAGSGAVGGCVAVGVFTGGAGVCPRSYRRVFRWVRWRFHSRRTQ